MTPHRPFRSVARRALAASLMLLCCALSRPVFAQSTGPDDPPETQSPESPPANAETPAQPPGTDIEQPLEPYPVSDPAEPPPAEVPEEKPQPAGDRSDDPATAPIADLESPPDTSVDSGPQADDGAPGQHSSTWFVLYGGAFGANMAAALIGPTDDNGEVTTSGAIAGLVGLGLGLGAGFWADRRIGLTPAQVNLTAWGGIWGALATGLATDLVTGVGDTTTNSVVTGAALGSLWGSLLSLAYGTDDRDLSESDVALFNSGGLYGLGLAFLTADILTPPTTEAYTINALLGTAIGLGVGAWTARRYDAPAERVRWIDVGVSVGGLAPWVVLYPIIADRAYGRQITDALSIAGMIGGGYLAWRMTRNMRSDGKSDDETASLPPMPGLLQRTGAGRWQVGAVSLRPALNPALSGARTDVRGAMLDVLGGRF